MYKIRFRGSVLEPMTVPDKIGQPIEEKWLKTSTDPKTKVKMNSLTFEIGKIETIEKISDSKAPDKVAEINQEDRKEYLTRARLSPQEKATHPLQMAGFLNCFQSVHGYHPKDELITMLQETLAKFFETHPKRTFADFKVYSTFLFKKSERPPIPRHTMAMIDVFALCIKNDINNAKFN